MSLSHSFHRRGVLGLFALAPAFAASRAVGAEPKPLVRISRDPNCGCCGGWAEHIRRAGFAVEVIETRELDAVKTRLGVPDALASCHTAEVGGYIVEGHVPAHAVEKLLREKPQARGIAVPGMPMGSPSMEGGRPETYDVVLFGGASGQASFGRYRGSEPV